MVVRDNQVVGANQEAGTAGEARLHLDNRRFGFFIHLRKI